MLARGTPWHIRSGNGPESAAVAVKEWLGNLGVNTAFIEPGSPWENGYVERFNSKLRDALLDGEIFQSLKEARILIEAWQPCNTVRPHSALGWQPPAPGVSVIPAVVWPRQGTSIAMATHATVHQHSSWIRRWGLANPGGQSWTCSPADAADGVSVGRLAGRPWPLPKSKTGQAVRRRLRSRAGQP